MAHRKNPDFDSSDDGEPESDDAFARGAGRDAADDELDAVVADPADASDPVSSAPRTTGTDSDLQRRLTEEHDRYLRLAAEYDNYRKRTMRERSELSARAQADLVKQLIDPIDDLARFAHVDHSTTDALTIAQGAEMVEKKLLKALAAAGLETVDPIDQTFDPKLHEAVATEPALSPEDDHVVSRVYQVGYLFGGQLLRPARVVVKQWNG
ncbi:MAG TPA: nucleotide exchange factor GrpE [Gemmatimonadaceae bacterium]|nr:nucleotide exchange factor GrpE [Gemmatimonadaceae bacterium]